MNNLSNIAQRILEAVSQPGATAAQPTNADDLYTELDQDLRLNQFDDEGGAPIVVFYTMKINDKENDVLHNAAGPAVTFGSGGDGEVFYFINGKQVEPDSDEYKNAAAALSIDVRSAKRSQTKTTGPAGGESDAGAAEPGAKPVKPRRMSDLSAFD